MTDERVADLVISLVRTWVPIGVGSALAWLATKGVDVPPDTAVTVGVLATAACAAAYYGLARLLERMTGAGVPDRAGRALGRWMLGGVVRQPVYVPPAVAAPLEPEPPVT